MARPPKSKRSVAVALALLDGKSAVDACKEAGYSDTTAESQAYKIIQRADIRKFLVEYGANVTRGDLSSVGRARLMEVLMVPDASARDLVPAIRVALEQDGQLGQQVQHKHTLEIPPAIQQMLAERMAAIQQARIDNSITVEAITVESQDAGNSTDLARTEAR